MTNEQLETHFLEIREMTNDYAAPDVIQEYLDLHDLSAADFSADQLQEIQRLRRVVAWIARKRMLRIAAKIGGNFERTKAPISSFG